jgi:uncharacterized membrane protein
MVAGAGILLAVLGILSSIGSAGLLAWGLSLLAAGLALMVTGYGWRRRENRHIAEVVRRQSSEQRGDPHQRP